MANGKVPDNSDQHTRFIETARALGCDEDEAAFDEKLKGIAPPKAKVTSAQKKHPTAEP